MCNYAAETKTKKVCPNFWLDIEMLYFSITRVTNGAYHICFIDQGVGRRRFLSLLQRLICAFLVTPKFLLRGLFLLDPMCIDGLLIIRRLVFIILKKNRLRG